MDKEKVRALRVALQAAVKGVEEAHGVKVMVAGARYTEDNCTIKVEVMDIGQDGQAIRKEATTLGRIGALYGLPNDATGKEFVLRGRRFKLVGLNTKASRFPILAQELASGKTFRMPLEDVKAALSAG